MALRVRGVVVLRLLVLHGRLAHRTYLTGSGGPRLAALSGRSRRRSPAKGAGRRRSARLRQGGA
eukprot:494458-Alexandrium_andersonii.AAC.1